MEPNTSIITGLDGIGAIFDRSRWTVRRWIRDEGFPAARLPNGVYFTTPSLIDAWVLARREADLERKPI